MVLCRLELTLLNMSFPTMVAMVGKTRAPHRIRVADTWSARGLASAGIRGTGQPIPAEMHRQTAESRLKHMIVFVPESTADLINRDSLLQCVSRSNTTAELQLQFPLLTISE